EGQELASHATALEWTGDAEIEEMRLSRRDGDDSVAGDGGPALHDPAVIARGQGIGKIAGRPGMRVDGLLDRDDRVEVDRDHAAVSGKRIESRAPRSSLLRATLSRMYTGAAASAATARPS